jgi:DNA-binding NarL/FixJ family response regulator
MPTRVLLADDHPIVRSGIRNELARYPDLEVVGEASDGQAVLELTEALRPELVLLDINMPGPKAVEVIRQLRARSAAPRILVLTAYSDLENILGLLKAGANGYLLKDEEPAIIAEGIRAIMQGRTWLSTSVAQNLVEHTARESDLSSNLLSERELEVLRLLARGYSNQRIAVELSIAERTVRFHVENILSKLNARNRTEAVTLAVQHKWIEL